MTLNQPIEALPNTSAITVKKLKNLGICTFSDLLNYIPFRYEHFSLVTPIEKVQPGETVTVKGRVSQVKNYYTRRGLKIQKVILDDSTGAIELVWYNQPYLVRIFRVGSYLSVSGMAEKFSRTLTMQPKEYEIPDMLDQETIHTGRIVPVYSERNRLSTRTIREKIFRVLRTISEIPDYLPQGILDDNQLIDEYRAYQNIHFPLNDEIAKKARERLAFDELFTIQLSTQLLKKEWGAKKPEHLFSLTQRQKTDLQSFISRLPFELTNAQKSVLAEITKDLLSDNPMNRFLQGDVGSGKTVIAAIASYIGFLNHTNTLVMAPTEILANQHFQTFRLLFKDTPVKIGLQTGSKKMVKDSSEFDVIIGTHALINQRISFEKIGFVVIDEQHRFGVAQRALLKEKGKSPHLLTMTATPIPRTVALTLYGELDVSTIDEMPKGRIPVKTYLVPPKKRSAGYAWIKKMMGEQHIQIFIVCPLIEESEIETMKSIRAAKQEFEYLKHTVFPDYRVGLLHGKIKPKEKDSIMDDFKNKKYDILVTTPVVEVGIDIPNATIMFIEAAERFGLAQLHQLRGRVGRGDKQSYCLLFTQREEKHIISRLQLFARTQNGIKLAEYDFKTRGPGNIYGIKQHGYLDLKVASLSDLKLIQQTKHAAFSFIQSYKIDDFPEIKKRVETYRAQQIARD